jgi:hypothetical protein
MKVRQFRLESNGVSKDGQTLQHKGASLVLVMGERHPLSKEESQDTIGEAFPEAQIVYCSTAGQIIGDSVVNDDLIITSISFDQAKSQAVCMNLEDFSDVKSLGAAMFHALDAPDLKSIFICSDGHQVNGSALKDGLEKDNLGRVLITGGLAGDGTAFEETITGIGMAAPGNVVGIGLYGECLELGYGSRGGWQYDNKMSLITDSEGNVLKELNGVPALRYYKEHLNGQLHTLPADALKFPLSISDPLSGQQLVRTILSVDEQKETMTFAGDMPIASGVQFLKAEKHELIDGARSAGIIAKSSHGSESPELAILVSCVGRKLVLGDETSKEIAAVSQALGHETPLMGFYSYGEMCPSSVHGQCELHNQTMTITTIRERA